jgi:hypothetical protein
LEKEDEEYQRGFNLSITIENLDHDGQGKPEKEREEKK